MIACRTRMDKLAVPLGIEAGATLVYWLGQPAVGLQILGDADVVRVSADASHR